MQTTFRLAAPAAALSLFVSFSTGSQADPGRWEADARRLAAPLIEAGVVPGLAIGIYEKGETAFVGVGSIKPGGDQPPTAHTIYEIGSISKGFTGLLLADAVRRGEVTLGTTASSLAPEGASIASWSDAESGDTVDYTLLDLTTHTSGLPRMPGDLRPTDAAQPFADYDAESLWVTLASTPPLTRPGAQYAYSNLGAGLLGQLLADRAGTSYPELIASRIAAPLGMTDTTVNLTDADPDRLAPGSTPGGDPVPSWRFGALAGAGAIRSTVADLLTLIDALVEPPTEEFARCTQLALANHRTAPGGPPMALGWHFAGDGFTRWHNGQTGGYHSMMLVRPSDGLGVIVLANGTEKAVDTVAERLIQAMMGMQVEPPSVRTSVDLSADQLDRLVGVYDSGLGLVYTITREGKTLKAQLTGQPALAVYPESDASFFYREVEARIVFELSERTDEATKDDATQATTVTLFQNGRQIPFTRQGE